VTGLSPCGESSPYEWLSMSAERATRLVEKHRGAARWLLHWPPSRRASELEGANPV